MLHNVLKRNNLNQIINKATKTDCKTVGGIPKTKNSLIDVLITNNPKSIKKHSTSLTPLVTDRNEISATIDIGKPKYKPITKTFRTHKTYSKKNLIKSIKGHKPDLNEIMNIDDVNNQINILNNVLLTAINNCAPLITTRGKDKQING